MSQASTIDSHLSDIKNASEMRFNTTTLSLLGFQLEAHWPERLCGIVMESACDRGCYEAFSLI